MQAFATLLERLVLTPQRNVKLRLLADYFRATPDPDRGYALAALTGDLDIASVKPAMLRALVVERVDEVLFAYSYDYVGDLAETISLVWPARGGVHPPGAGRVAPLARGGVALGRIAWHEAQRRRSPPASRSAFASGLRRTTPDQVRGRLSPLQGEAKGRIASDRTAPSRRDRRAAAAGLAERRAEADRGLARRLDATGRWALIKLVTGGLRVGVSARLAKQALADLGGKEVNEIEEVWHGLAPPYADLFAWLEGRGERPESTATARRSAR